LALNQECLCAQFNFACVEFGIDRLCITGEDFACDCDDRFRGAAFRALIKFFIWIDDDLADAVMVAKVDEQRIGMFAFTVDPAR